MALQKTKTIEEKLKELVGKEVNVMLEHKLRYADGGSFGSRILNEPIIHLDEFHIRFMGVQGLRNHPAYIYGIDAFDSEKKLLFTHSSDVWADEDDGIPYFDRDSKVLAIYCIDMRSWLSGFMLEDSAMLVDRIREEGGEPNPSLVMKRIMNGNPDYAGRLFSCSYSMIDDQYFIGQVLKYTDEII